MRYRVTFVGDDDAREALLDNKIHAIVGEWSLSYFDPERMIWVEISRHHSREVAWRHAEHHARVRHIRSGIPEERDL